MIPEKLVQDLQVLQTRGFNCDPPVEKDCRIYVVFKDFPLPSGLYNMETTDLLIFTTVHYPGAGFDMFWTDPSLTLSNGEVPKSADAEEQHLNKNWRRFSYHPYNGKSWNPSEDDVIRFVGYVQQRLCKGD